LINYLKAESKLDSAFLVRIPYAILDISKQHFHFLSGHLRVDLKQRKKNLPFFSYSSSRVYFFPKKIIDLKPNLFLGTDITNQVAISFDYNAPVITNEIVNTFTKELNVFSPIINTLQVGITPAVIDDEIRVHYVIGTANYVSMQIYNVGGVLLQDIDFGKKQTGEHVENVSLKDFIAGVYFVFVKTEEGSAVRKVVKF
jgi:hypothetical protein